ncbi:hypothetical protein E4665_16275 [Sporolactobacillus shoreae]|uniref:DUF4352 domain-containing protein n=1 Tax=Sporolactobacillus shoreae TaxID=1465501 RepID=A0A4Z0GI67_9BACL|nr:hypothetical protein [Sporolactobacillus shoreae]TGA96239.1 hypothetical protein E4665_16275 [Sporolactobacillus shoreae]
MFAPWISQSFFITLAGFVCSIIFGIMLIVRGANKGPKKELVIATSLSGGGLLLGIILLAIGLILTPNHGYHDFQDNWSYPDSSDTSDPSSDINNSSAKVISEAKLNYSDTYGQQTTRIPDAKIEDVSGLGWTDDNDAAINYALVISLSITNHAGESASSYPWQGYFVLPDGTQINAAEGLQFDLQDSFQDGDIESGATNQGYVVYPLSETSASSLKSGQLYFEVYCGDSKQTSINYHVPIEFTKNNL